VETCSGRGRARGRGSGGRGPGAFFRARVQEGRGFGRTPPSGRARGLLTGEMGPYFASACHRKAQAEIGARNLDVRKGGRGGAGGGGGGGGGAGGEGGEGKRGGGGNGRISRFPHTQHARRELESREELNGGTTKGGGQKGPRDRPGRGFFHRRGGRAPAGGPMRQIIKGKIPGGGNGGGDFFFNLSGAGRRVRGIEGARGKKYPRAGPRKEKLFSLAQCRSRGARTQGAGGNHSRSEALGGGGAGSCAQAETWGGGKNWNSKGGLPLAVPLSPRRMGRGPVLTPVSWASARPPGHRVVLVISGAKKKGRHYGRPRGPPGLGGVSTPASAAGPTRFPPKRVLPRLLGGPRFGRP